jgi:glycosyltransferase involved in cell wall biosynthesis
MRVLIPSLRGTSGIATYTLALARGLGAAGHEAIVLDETGIYDAPDGVEVVPFQPPPKLPAPVEPAAEWARIREVGRLAREHEVDGIHATRLGFVPGGGKLVSTNWDPILTPRGRFRAASVRGEPRVAESIYAMVDGFAAFRAAAIVAVTPAVQRSYDRFGRCEYIPPFLADEAIAPVRPRRNNDVVMVAGAVDLERKGLDLALAAMAIVRERIEDARLVLVGGWIDADRPGSLPEHCLVRGRLSPAEVTAAFAAAGCCAIPSKWEEFGYVGLEALAAGIPVATTPLPGYADLSGGGAFVAPDWEPRRLAEQIELALAATDFAFPEECRASTAIARILELYETAFAGEGDGRASTDRGGALLSTL